MDVILFRINDEFSIHHHKKFSNIRAVTEINLHLFMVRMIITRKRNKLCSIGVSNFMLS